MKTLFIILSSTLIIFSFTFQNRHSPDTQNAKGIVGLKLNLQYTAPPTFAETIKNEAGNNNLKNDAQGIDQNWYQNAIEKY